jgi:hypothetical protein
VGNNEVPVVVSKLGVVGPTSRERGGLNSTINHLNARTLVVGVPAGL